MRAILHTASCWVLAAAAGALADAAGFPIGWILGPMIVAAAFSVADTRPHAPLSLRRFGQLIVGIAIGLNMTAGAAAHLVTWFPAMAATGLISILLAASLSPSVARLGRVDIKTAYFAMMPGGLAEMANVGSALGARSEVISLSQALRASLTVLLVPPLVLAIAEDGGIFSAGRADPVGWTTLSLLMGASLVGVLLLSRTRVANAWMLGALAVTGLLAGGGIVEGRMPAPVLWLGQFFIGLTIGIRFKRDMLRRLPWLAAVCSVFTVLLGAVLFGLAAMLHIISGLDLGSAMLGASPGGFVEMTLTAQVLHLDVALVTGFQFVRAFMVNGLAALIWGWLDRIGWFAVLQRLVGSPPGGP